VWSERFASEANRIISEGRNQLASLIEDHEPRYPASLATLYDELPKAAQPVSDAAFKATLRKAFDAIRDVWKTASDFDALTDSLERSLERRAREAGIPLPPEELRPTWPPRD